MEAPRARRRKSGARFLRKFGASFCADTAPPTDSVFEKYGMRRVGASLAQVLVQICIQA
jgi:hypothetical protein